MRLSLLNELLFPYHMQRGHLFGRAIGIAFVGQLLFLVFAQKIHHVRIAIRIVSATDAGRPL